MGVKILKIALGAVTVTTGALVTKYGISMKVEKKAAKAEEAKVEETATEEKTEETVEEEKVEEPEKAEKRIPRKGGKKWRKAQAEQNK